MSYTFNELTTVWCAYNKVLKKKKLAITCFISNGSFVAKNKSSMKRPRDTSKHSNTKKRRKILIIIK